MSRDSFEWDEQDSRFTVQVMAGIFVYGMNADQTPEITCGFLEGEDHELRLPSACITDQQHAAHVAVSLFKKYVGIDPRTLDITPFGFFDPLRPPLDESLMAQRTIYLGYKTNIHPGTPVNPDLRFMRYEELEIARSRVARGHYEAYRTGVSG